MEIISTPVQDSETNKENETELLEKIRNMIKEELLLANRIKELPRLLDIEEVAIALRVSIRTLETLIAEGEFVPIWIRGQRRFTQKAIESYLNSSAGRKPGKRRRAA